MKTVEYDAPTETVRLSMGNTWGDVYSALIPYSRIVVGGRIPPVGMALVTGGKRLAVCIPPSKSPWLTHSMHHDVMGLTGRL